MRTIALREALHEEMARDDSVFVMGEDVIAHGGPYTVTQGAEELVDLTVPGVDAIRAAVRRVMA